MSRLLEQVRDAVSTRHYREVLALPIGWVDDVERAKRPKRLPVVFTREEVGAVLSRLRAEMWLMASLLYGSGLRLMECVGLCRDDDDLHARPQPGK